MKEHPVAKQLRDGDDTEVSMGVALAVKRAVKAHTGAYAGGVDGWWLFVRRVLPDAALELAQRMVLVDTEFAKQQQALEPQVEPPAQAARRAEPADAGVELGAPGAAGAREQAVQALATGEVSRASTDEPQSAEVAVDVSWSREGREMHLAVNVAKHKAKEWAVAVSDDGWTVALTAPSHQREIRLPTQVEPASGAAKWKRDKTSALGGALVLSFEVANPLLLPE